LAAGSRHEVGLAELVPAQRVLREKKRQQRRQQRGGGTQRTGGQQAGVGADVLDV
jgi:hypothetical protein